MLFEDFKQFVLLNIRDYLPDGYKDADITIEAVQKNNNNEYEGLCIRGDKDTISPVLNLNQYYQKFLGGSCLKDILEEVTQRYLSQKNSSSGLGLENFMLENVREQLYVAARNAEKNEHMLRDIPHEIRGDIALIYRVRTQMDDGCFASFVVSNRFLKWWGINEQYLAKIAWDNMRNNFKPTFNSLNAVVEEIGGVSLGDEPNILWIITNKDSCDGAAYMFDEEFLEKVSEQLKDDIWIIPSSIHEALIVKKTPELDVEALMQTIRQTNESHVIAEEVLSDSLYQYEQSTKKVSMVIPKKQEQLLNLGM